MVCDCDSCMRVDGMLIEEINDISVTESIQIIHGQTSEDSHVDAICWTVLLAPCITWISTLLGSIGHAMLQGMQLFTLWVGESFCQ